MMPRHKDLANPHILYVRIDPVTAKHLRDHAASTGMTQSALARHIFQGYYGINSVDQLKPKAGSGYEQNRE